MRLEHRWSSRKEISLDVNLYYPPVGMINGTTRNISLEGMFVDTHGIDIPRQARLEVAFRTQHGNREKVHRLPAYVVHGSEGGVGLMLQHVCYHEFDALRYIGAHGRQLVALAGRLVLRMAIGQAGTEARHVERAWRRIREAAAM